MPGQGSRRDWWLVAGWVVFMLTLTSIPGQALPDMRTAFRIDRLAHFCIYFGLGWLVARAGMMRGWSVTQLTLAWVAIVVFGALDELHQVIIPNRSGDVVDWLMDAAGSWLGLASAFLLKRKTWAARLLQ